MKGIAGIFQQMSRRFGELSRFSSGKGSGTIIVHPQMSETIEEAKELDNDWGKREEKQLRENLLKAMRGK